MRSALSRARSLAQRARHWRLLGVCPLPLLTLLTWALSALGHIWLLVTLWPLLDGLQVALLIAAVVFSVLFACANDFLWRHPGALLLVIVLLGLFHLGGEVPMAVLQSLAPVAVVVWVARRLGNHALKPDQAPPKRRSLLACHRDLPPLCADWLSLPLHRRPPPLASA